MNQFKQAISLICGSSRSRAGRMSDLVTEVLGIVLPLAAGFTLAAGVLLALVLGLVFAAAGPALGAAPLGFVLAPVFLGFAVIAAAAAIRISRGRRRVRSLATRGFVDTVVLLRRSAQEKEREQYQ